MVFPEHRLSRLRGSKNLRQLVSENRLTTDDLIQPIFIHHGQGIQNEIPSMPGQYQRSIENSCAYARTLYTAGVKAILLFGIPEKKDAQGSDSWDDKNGIIQNALRALKKEVPEMLLITDVCFCEYTDHGHCGIMTELNGKQVLNHDETLNNLALQAISHARAGADIVAPSGMIDGAVGVIRESLDAEGFSHLPIMAYSAKYASAFYGPFRDAAEGTPQFGDRRTHQMDVGNSNEALREIELDVEEGADLIMVKPALSFLDIIRRAKDTFNLPTVCYNVSGEYSMVKAAAAQGWVDEKDMVLEILTSMKRAGADLIITYHAEDVCRWLGEG